VLPLAGCE